MSDNESLLCAMCGQHVSLERARVMGFEATDALREFAPTAPTPIDSTHEAATAFSGTHTLPAHAWLDERAAQASTPRQPRALDALDQAAIEDEDTYAPERGAAIAIQLTVLITVVALFALIWVHFHG